MEGVTAMKETELRTNGQTAEKRTAGEAGWHYSRYNLSAPVPGKDTVAIANLYRGTCAEYNPLELYLLSIMEKLDEHHPAIERFAKRGIIVRFDEREALETLGRAACAAPRGIGLTICPTMNCNFDCPYCFEKHRPGRMSPEVQDDVVNLTRRMLEAGAGKRLHVTWFGGEPLLAADVIASLSERLIALAEEYHASYSAGIVTNGYLLSQKNIDMLERCRVTSCQVTLDGLGEKNDMTRRLAGGGPTFARITDNLRNGKIPFKVQIRQNVQESNLDEVPKVKAFIEQLARESGNTLNYSPAPVTENEATEERGEHSRILCEEDISEIALMQEARHFTTRRGYYCGANLLYSVGIDETGRLFKCWENAANPELSFANAHDWDPLQPLETAYDPDMMIRYMNTTLPLKDEECGECVWLPMCAGGCPHRRLYDRKSCIGLRNEPEKFVLALYARIGKEKQKKEEEEKEKAQHRPEAGKQEETHG